MAKKRSKQQQKGWMPVGSNKKSPVASKETKAKIQEAFEEVIEQLKKEHVKEIPLNREFNYLIDIPAYNVFWGVNFSLPLA